MARIALVDGDPELVTLITFVLEESDHEVVAITCPDSVVPQLTARPPDLLILDPWLDTPRQGWEILNLLIADERTRGVPVIVYSGAIDHLREKGDWLRCHRIRPLEKPFDLRDLEQMVNDAIAW
jgi:DNA-binding NtrC family response regulator